MKITAEILIEKLNQAERNCEQARLATEAWAARAIELRGLLALVNEPEPPMPTV